MKHTSVIISTYTADVSGICSALYELGGMVVIHDPSGCNSTYNTHDEPRWYDQDSLIFISGLSEIDAIMGSDDKLIRDITRAAKQLRPRFIALVQTPVPMMTGVDFYGIRDILEAETGLPVWFFPTSGMHSYVQGVNMALAAVARHMVPETCLKDQYLAGEQRIEKQNTENHRPGQNKTWEPAPHNTFSRPLSVNLIGVTPLDFSVNTTLESVKKLLTDQQIEIISCFAMGSNLEEFARAGEADVNLVVSSAGIEAAKVLYERFATPYVVGLPTGAFAGRVTDALKESAISGECTMAYDIENYKNKNDTDTNNIQRTNRNKNNKESDDIGKNDTSADDIIKTNKENDNTDRDCIQKKYYIIGEPVTAQSIRQAVRQEYGISLTVLCYLEVPRGLLDDHCIYLSSEEEMKEKLKDADVVIADPMYRPICPSDVHFISFPHEAFSGRIYREGIPDLTKPEEIMKWWYKSRNVRV